MRIGRLWWHVMSHESKSLANRMPAQAGILTRRVRTALSWPVDLGSDVKLLFQGALVLFALSVVVGMIEGQNRLTLSTDLGDVHMNAGTFGWLTLSTIAFAVLLFAPRQPTQLDLRLTHILSVLAVVCTSGYALAAIVGYGNAVVVGSAAMLLTAVAFVGWLGMRVVQTHLEIAHLAILLAALVLVFGSTVSFLLAVQDVTQSTLFPDDTPIVQPIILDSGYLLLVGVGLLEWGRSSVLVPVAGAATSAVTSAADGAAKFAVVPFAGALAGVLPFLALCALAFAILMNAPGLIPLCAALELTTAAILAVRMWPALPNVPWRERAARRSFALAAVFAPLYLVLFVYVLVRVSLGSYTSFGSVPVTTTAGIDHLLFVGVLSNALFGLLALLTRYGTRFWPATDDIVFWGMNVGLVGLVLGFFAHNAVLMPLLEGLFSPILGASVLVGVVAYTVRLQTARMRLVPPLSPD